MNNGNDEDDFFGSDDDAHPSRDWNKLHQNAKNVGYKEGLESNQDSLLQSGFNRGFKDALLMSFQAGEIQGKICALMTSKPPQDTDNKIDEQAPLSHSKKLQEILTSDLQLIESIPSLLSTNVERIVSETEYSTKGTFEQKESKDLSSVLDDNKILFMEKINSLKSQLKEVGGDY